MNQLDELKRLGELRAKGILSEAEFAAQKARVLGTALPPVAAPIVPPAPIATPEPPAPEANKYSDLDRLVDLKKRGILTDDEFAREKAALLGMPYIPVKSQAEINAEAQAEKQRKNNEQLAAKLKAEEEKRYKETEARKTAEQERNALLRQLKEKQQEDDLRIKQAAEAEAIRKAQQAETITVATPIEIVAPTVDIPQTNTTNNNLIPLTETVDVTPDAAPFYTNKIFIGLVMLAILGIAGGYYYTLNAPISTAAVTAPATDIIPAAILTTTAESQTDALAKAVNEYYDGHKKKLTLEKKAKFEILKDDIAYAQKNAAANTAEKNKLNYEAYSKEFEALKK